MLLDISQVHNWLWRTSDRTGTFSSRANTTWCFARNTVSQFLIRLDAKLKKLIRQVCDETQSALIEMEVMPDHVHLLVGCDPQYGIHRLVKGIKRRSSRVLRQQFRVLRTRIPTLWTNSYFVSSVGGTPLALIKQYIENQKRV